MLHVSPLSNLIIQPLLRLISQSQPKIGKFSHVGGVLKLSEPGNFKTEPGFENCPRFVGVIEQNKYNKLISTTV